jgi:hypothetical protein
MRRSCTVLLRRLRGSEGRTVRDVLGLGSITVEPISSLDAFAATADPETIYREYVETFGRDLMRRFDAVAVSAGHSGAPPRLAVKIFVLPGQVDRARLAVPEELVWRRPEHPPIRLRTAVESARPVKKR